MNVTIRHAVAADAADIARLSHQLGYQVSEEETALQIGLISGSDNDIACIAADGNNVVGWIHAFYTLRLETAPYCEIGGLVVDEKFRGHGIGRKLIDFVKPWCTQKSCTDLRVRSNITRDDAHKFYLKAGFSEIKQQKVFKLVI